MNKLPAIKGSQLVRLLKQINFVMVRQNGSHVLMRDHQGRVVIVPIHSNKDLPKGLVNTIIKEDLKITHEEFYALIEKCK